jgi:rRNA-processing protein FCF1
VRVRVILDTNALMMPGQFGIDLFEELGRLVGAYDAVTPRSVIRELEKIARGRGKDANAARIGLELSRRHAAVEERPALASVDEEVIRAAEEKGGLVVTNDRGLREALLARGVGVVSMRKQRVLEIIRG